MKNAPVPIACLASCTLFLASCGALVSKDDVSGGQYWQRVSSSSAIYQQGPKAQQLLHRDIARCVVELRELERLGVVKNAIPYGYRGRLLDPDQLELDGWDTPEHDGALLAEHSDYHDFEGCMLAKGWERIKYVPFDIAEKSRRNYLEAQVDYQFQSRFEKKKRRVKTQEDGAYGEMND